MKKSLLLLVAGAMAISASAQYAKPSSLLLGQASTAANSNAPLGKKINAPQERIGVPGRRSSSRTTSITGTPVYTETFPSTVFTIGGSGGITDVWTTGPTAGASPAGCAWHQTDVASTSNNNIGTLASTTASNGWMIIDGDSLYSLSTTGAYLPGAYLQSPAINCTGLTTVGLSFQQLYQGGYQDTCYIGVSTSPTFTTATYYPIAPGAHYDSYDRTPNPDTVNLNITSAAAGHTVYIRFIYQDQMHWDFSWLIDDVAVGALAPHDVQLFREWMYKPDATTAGAAPSSIFEIPLIFVDNTDSIYPIATLTNAANSIEASLPVTANIYNGSTSVFSQTYTYPSLAVHALDSLVQFEAPGYAPSSMGQYTCAFNANLATDADPANNVDTVTFDISDSTWNENYGQFISDYAFFIYGSTATTGASPAIQSFFGTRFDVGPNINVPGTGVYPSDTISGFGVAFSSDSKPMNSGGTAMVQLYQRTSTGTWNFQASSVARRLTTSDYNSSSFTPSTINYAYFPTFTGYGPSATVGTGNFVLAANNTYAAVVQISGVTTDLLIMATVVPPAYYFVDYLGESFASNDDGEGTFGTTNATGETVVPMVNMYFGKIPNQNYNVGVQNVTTDNFIGQPFPNPSTTSFTIALTMAQDNKVKVSLMDMMGQEVNTQNINAIGGQPATAVFNTSNLADGIYIYAIQGNGVNTTGRVVVAH